MIHKLGDGRLTLETLVNFLQIMQEDIPPRRDCLSTRRKNDS
jgi:hypothetical protein